MTRPTGTLVTEIRAEADVTLFHPEQPALFADNILEFAGQKFVPDDTKGYFQFRLSHAFPAGATAYGTALTAAVVEKSYRSLLHQDLNLEHQIKLYHDDPKKKKPNYVEDRVLGAVVAVDFPRAPAQGWRLGQETPAINGVAVFFKQTTGMQRIVGEHQTGRHKYTVSMEVFYPYDEAGFAIEAKNGKAAFDSTPRDFAEAGFDYVPYKSASDELKATFSVERNRIVDKFHGRATWLLMGGLSSPVHYAGVGLVKYGAEKTAQIVRMAASEEPLAGLGEALLDAFGSLAKNKC